MGTRGPVKKSSSQRKLEGNAGKKPMHDEVKPAPIVPDMPKWLGKDAKQEWKFIVPHLEKLGLLTVIDGAALAIYCNSYARWRQAEKEIDLRGTTYETSRGTIQKHPAVTVSKQYYGAMKEMLGEFGLTPQARSRMSITSEDTDNDSDFLGY